MTTDLELNLSSSLHYMQVKLLLLDSDFACGGNMHVDVTYSWFVCVCVCVCVCVRKNEMLFKWLYKVSNEYGLGDSAVKKLPAVPGTLVQSPGWEDLLEEGMAIMRTPLPSLGDKRFLEIFSQRLFPRSRGRSRRPTRTGVPSRWGLTTRVSLECNPGSLSPLDSEYEDCCCCC